MRDDNWLNAIKTRLLNVSQGPWRTPEESVLLHGNRLAPYHDDQVIVDHEGCAVWPWKNKADMKFAYAARTDIPDLLKEIERLRSILDDHGVEY